MTAPMPRTFQPPVPMPLTSRRLVPRPGRLAFAIALALAGALQAARAASASSSTHSCGWHSAGGSSPIADERYWFLTTARIPAASSTLRE